MSELKEEITGFIYKIIKNTETDKFYIASCSVDEGRLTYSVNSEKEFDSLREAESSLADIFASWPPMRYVEKNLVTVKDCVIFFKEP